MTIAVDLGSKATKQTKNNNLFLESMYINLLQLIFFKLVSVAEETGFSLALSETPKTGFVASQPI